MIASSYNPRHRALMALTGLMGLRVSEAVSVRPANINLTTMMLTVRGKGDKTRVVPISDVAWTHMVHAYKVALDQGKTLVDRSERGARASITRHGKRAGLSAHVKSHDMRATLATAAFAATRNVRAVQEILGHANITTTQVYTEVTDDDMRKALAVT